MGYKRHYLGRWLLSTTIPTMSAVKLFVIAAFRCLKFTIRSYRPWSGEVVGVLEFYEIATDFQHSLNHARLQSWLAVVAFTTSFFGNSVGPRL